MRKGIPNLGALQAFEATARLGSFSRAADELALTHSAVHRQITGLEERLGVKLFNRVRRRISLTEPGQEYAARIRQHLEQLEKDTLGLVSRSGLGRSLHIAVLPTLATAWLIPRLPDFQRLHPDIAISLSLRTLPFSFADHPFDAAIYHSHAMWPGTNSSLLFDEESVIPVCSPELLKKLEGLGSEAKSAKKRTTMAQPDHQPLAHFTHIHITSRPDAWRHWYASQNQAYPAFAAGGPRYELFSMVLAAVYAGLGVGLLPRFLVSEAIKQGDLVMPVHHPLPVSQGYYFGSSLNAESTPALHAFQAWLLHAGKVFLEQTRR